MKLCIVCLLVVFGFVSAYPRPEDPQPEKPKSGIATRFLDGISRFTNMFIKGEQAVEGFARKGAERVDHMIGGFHLPKFGRKHKTTTAAAAGQASTVGPTSTAAPTAAPGGR